MARESRAASTKTVVVTGVSTGIGRGAAKVLTQKGFRVFGSVRKPADAERLSAECGAGFTPLFFDVTDEAAVATAADQVRAALGGQTLSGLVNNAGVAVAGPMLHLEVADFRQQLEINLIGAVIVTQAFAPLLGVDPSLAGPPGRIVNISSVGGRNATPFLGPYNASKFALEGLSESLRRELLLFGIDVIVIGPGAVATAIWGKANEVDVTAYRHTPFAPALDKVRAYMNGIGAKGLKPEVLGEAIAEALTARKPKVRYSVTPEPMQDFLVNHLPKRMVDRTIGRRLGLLP
jgi:NAD(P)-dependent dehydrogenase (short-subunit alcohol dehydrogenase family)